MAARPHQGLCCSHECTQPKRRCVREEETVGGAPLFANRRFFWCKSCVEPPITHPPRRPCRVALPLSWLSPVGFVETLYLDQKVWMHGGQGWITSLVSERGG